MPKKIMMTNNIQIEEAIQNYIDGLGTPEERSRIAGNIQTIAEWKDVYTLLMELDGLIRNNWETMEPSMRFQKTVMEEVALLKIAKPSKEYIHPGVFYGIGGLLLLMLLGVLGYAISQSNWTLSTGENSVFQFPDVSLPAINWSKYLNSQFTWVIFLINGLLGFTLLDIYIRKKKHAEANG